VGTEQEFYWRLSEKWDSKIGSWVLWDLEPRITVLARASSNLAASQDRSLRELHDSRRQAVKYGHESRWTGNQELLLSGASSSLPDGQDESVRSGLKVLRAIRH
jgi:hypothetical protein